MDASDRQVLYSNQLLPIEENLRKILKHYDQFGFGNGFELTKPHYQGKFSGVVDLKQIEEEKEGKKEKELNKSKSIIDKLDKMNESYKLRYTDSSNQLRKTRNLNEEFSAAKVFLVKIKFWITLCKFILEFCRKASFTFKN